MTVSILDYDAPAGISLKLNKMTIKRILFTLVILGIVCGSSISVQADPLTFSNVMALQGDGGTRIDLLSQPNLTLIGPQISFLVDISGIVPQDLPQVLSITFSEAGQAPVTQTFQIPFGAIQPPFSLVFSINALGASFQGVQAALTLDIIGSDPDFVDPVTGQRQNSKTYNFKVEQPIPEPTSMVLLSLGLAGLFEKRRRSRKRR